MEVPKTPHANKKQLGAFGTQPLEVIGTPGRMKPGTGLSCSASINRIPWAEQEVAVLLRRKLLKGIEDLQTGPTKVFVIASCNRQAMATGSGGNVSVFQGHSLPVLAQQVLPVGPDVGNRYVEAEDATAERVHQPPQPVLKFPAWIWARAVPSTRISAWTRPPSKSSSAGTPCVLTGVAQLSNIAPP